MRKRIGAANAAALMLMGFCAFEATLASLVLLSQTGGLYNDRISAFYCIGGSVLGALVSLMFMPEIAKAEVRYVVRTLSMKFCAAAAVGLVGAPPLVEYWGVTSGNYIIGLSGILSFCGISVLHVIVPEIPKAVKTIWRNKVKDYTGVEIKTERYDEPMEGKTPSGDRKDVCDK